MHEIEILKKKGEKQGKWKNESYFHNQRGCILEWSHWQNGKTTLKKKKRKQQKKRANNILKFGVEVLTFGRILKWKYFINN